MRVLKKLSLYLNTLRYLKNNQIYNYALFYIKKNILNFWYAKKVSRLNCSLSTTPVNLYPRPVLKTSHLLSEKIFVFLNHEVQFHGSIKWNDERLAKLWLYNLHYFDYILEANDKATPESYLAKKSILLDWLRANPVGLKNGWEPFPLSLRIVNWLYFYHSYFKFIDQEPEFKREFLKSLYQQCAYLVNFIEYHLMANHLFKNIKALYLAGNFFEKQSWINIAGRLLIRELDEQILDDGGHFERSPAYHSVFIEDILDIINFQENYNYSQGAVNIDKLKVRAEKMMDWLKKIIQPDMEIPLFGDSVFGVSLTFKQLQNYYHHFFPRRSDINGSSGFETLDSSAYYIFRSSDQYFIITGGKLTAPYQPGHAHADIFSFEYSYQGKRYIVDTGPGEYLNTELRQKARSVCGHNCLVIENVEQAELWDTFRMAKRIEAGEIQVNTDRARLIFNGSYNNNLYRSHHYHHNRNVLFHNMKFFIITDTYKTENCKVSGSLIHLHPGCKIETNANSIRISRELEPIYLCFKKQESTVSIKEWFYTPQFGRKMDTKVISIKPKSLDQTNLVFAISPQSYREEAISYLADKKSTG